MSKIKNRLYRLPPLSVAQTHRKTGLFTPNANSSPGRVIDFRSRNGEPASGAAEFDFVRHLETVEDVFANLCLVLNGAKLRGFGMFLTGTFFNSRNRVEQDDLAYLTHLLEEFFKPPVIGDGLHEEGSLCL